MGKRHFRLIIILIISLTLFTYAESKLSTKKLKNELLGVVDAKSELLVEVSDALWEYAEIALLEYKSSKLLIEVLGKEGFDVEREVAGMPTAFASMYYAVSKIGEEKAG